MQIYDLSYKFDITAQNISHKHINLLKKGNVFIFCPGCGPLK